MVGAWFYCIEVFYNSIVLFSEFCVCFSCNIIDNSQVDNIL